MTIIVFFPLELQIFKPWKKGGKEHSQNDKGSQASNCPHGLLKFL
jgi:hypothetical protein